MILVDTETDVIGACADGLVWRIEAVAHDAYAEFVEAVDGTITITEFRAPEHGEWVAESLAAAVNRSHPCLFVWRSALDAAGTSMLESFGRDWAGVWVRQVLRRDTTGED